MISRWGDGILEFSSFTRTTVEERRSCEEFPERGVLPDADAFDILVTWGRAGSDKKDGECLL